MCPPFLICLHKKDGSPIPEKPGFVNNDLYETGEHTSRKTLDLTYALSSVETLYVETDRAASGATSLGL